jgi:hypothetical protein
MMSDFLRRRSLSLSMVALVLLVTSILQEGISYTTAFGRLDEYIPGIKHGLIPSAWLIFRGILVAIIIGLWLMNRMRQVFKVIIVANSVLTFGLLMNMVALVAVLFSFSSQAIKTLLVDVVLLAVSNILIFSIWYWIIDPPGVEDTRREDAPWEFLFPQRGASLPHYETWEPRFTDYLYLAFTTSFAFSPTDALPLTRRAKMLMLLQSTISIITLTGIAGSAINILAGSH